MSDSFLLAATQAAPVYLDAAASLVKACNLIEEAGRKGADLIAFGETWLPGYPFFAFSGPSVTRWEAAEAYLSTAIEIPGKETDQLCAAAKAENVDVVIGVAELDQRTKGTTYCTMLSIGREGLILGSHRKLKPTMEERIVWGEGAGDDLHVYERPYARTSALACWEHQMCLPGYALMAQGTQVHVAGWPGGDPETPPEPPAALWARQELLSRAFAAQGACYVVASGGLITPGDVPQRFRSLAYKGSGGTMIIDPRGEVVQRAAKGEETIIYHQASQSVVRGAKAANDVAGHYARPDVFQLLVRGRPVTELHLDVTRDDPDE